jgi:transcriptional regulator with XRE-family HTH domain
MERPTSILAQNLRRLREERNFSLAQLSELTGVSKSMLRQIEIGQSSPTIATLWKIANGLRVPFTALLRKQQSEVTLRAFTENEPLTGESEGYRLFPLVLFDPHRPFEIYYVEIDPETTLNADPHQGNAEEHVFILQGQMGITVGKRRHTVNQDHFMSFAADCVHQYQNLGHEMVAAIMMISYLS